MTPSEMATLLIEQASKTPAWKEAEKEFHAAIADLVLTGDREQYERRFQELKAKFAAATLSQGEA